MAPRRRSTKRGPKIANNKMKGGQSWCCIGEECKEKGSALTCSSESTQYICSESDMVNSDDVTKTGKCTKAVFTGNNWCCDGGKCKEQGLGLTCLPGHDRLVCPVEVKHSDDVRKTCRPSTATLVANRIGTRIGTAADSIGTAIKNSGNTFVNFAASNGGKKSKRRKSKKTRRTNKRK
jgi:hypothetical protein